MRIFILCLFLFSVVCTQVSAQCPTGSEPPCMCSTAEVLCSVSALNNFTGFLEPFQHPQDGPSPFCGSSTITQNPTWFAFIAWCDEIDMDVDFTNCTVDQNGYGGAQLAVYTDCTFNNQVDCNETCVGANGTVTVNMDNLTIGESYYVMLDGCGGSTCDYQISVSPTSCDEQIEDWNNDLTDELVVCIGDTESYEADDLIGATSWHWFIDGSEEDVTSTPNFDMVWNTAGTFELCVDASNICVDVDQDPSPNCVTIFVADPNAGELDADENPLCPKEFSFVEVTNFNAAPEYEQYLIFVDMEDEVVHILQRDWEDFTWPTCEGITVYSLNVPIGEDVDIPKLEDRYFGSDCITNCCDEKSLLIEFIDNDAPTFDDEPADISVGCLAELQSIGLDDIDELDVSDNCAEDAEVMGMETVNVDTCLGGMITRMWTFMDDCGNVASHTQTISIGALPQAMYLTLPRDTTMTTQGYGTYTIDSLEYSNGAAGGCELMGKSAPVIEEVRNGCSGSVTVRYMYTDPCGRQTAAIQIITLEQDVAALDTLINYCDIDEQGTVDIFQVDLDMLVADDITGYTIAYYPNPQDMAAMTNQLVFPINSSMLPLQIIYAAITDPQGCSSELVITINVSPLPDLSLIETDETCINDNDGRIDIIVDAHGLPYTLLLDTDTVRTFSLTNLPPSTYSFSLEDSLGCTSQDIAVIESGIELRFEVLVLGCDNNQTGTDGLDDTYSVRFVGEGGTGSFDILINGVSTNNAFTYDIQEILDLPASGLPTILTLVDNQTGCRTDADIGTLAPCSDDCELTLEVLTTMCNSNGTLSDGSDDFYEFIIEVSAINGSSSGIYTVLANGVLVSNFLYGDTETFVLPADGNDLTLIIEDELNLSCFITEPIPDPLMPCSSLCQLDIEVLSVDCMDAGTSDNNDDDLFDISFMVTGVNTASDFSVSNTGTVENYGETVTITNLLITDGDYLLQVADSDDSNCTTDILVTAPLPCSMPCNVSLENLVVMDCNDNTTGMNDNDDIYFIEFSVTSVAGSDVEYLLEDQEGNSYGPFLYGMDVNVGPLPADGNDNTLTLIDLVNGNCDLVITSSQFPCSLCNHTLDIAADFLLLDCANTASTLTGIGDAAISDYQWVGPDNFSADTEEITVSEPGEYILTATWPDGCELVKRETISVSNDKPLSNAGGDLILNCEITSVTLSSALSTQGPDIIINWLDSDGNIISDQEQFDVSDPGVYGLLLIDDTNQCRSDIDEIEVIELMSEPGSVIYANPGNVLDCFVDQIVLTYESQSNTVYEWRVDNQVIDEEELVIASEQEVMLVAIDTISACESDTTLFISDLMEYPIIQLDDNHTIDCQTMMSCVSFSSISSGNTMSSWYDADNNLLSNDEEMLCIGSPGTYTLELMDLDNSCVNVDTFTVDAAELLTVELPSSISILTGAEQQLNPIINLPENQLASILWETEAQLSCYDCLSPTLEEAADSTEIQVTITTLEGCTAIALLIVDIIKVPRIYIPNIMDIDQGEKFTIFSNKDIDTIDELYIYDRWGNTMFQNLAFPTNDSSEGWNGRINDRTVEQGVYVYYLSYTIDGTSEISAGTVTVIR